MSTTTGKVHDNADRLFIASCLALITTAFSFSISAGILDARGEALGLSAQQSGLIQSMWFLGFPISMVIGGLLYNRIGGKIIMQFAFLAHAVGIILTIFSGNYSVLLFSTLLIGLGNGCTEAACNPMIADAYRGTEMAKKMNRFHMWFPGGIALGSIISFIMGDKLGLPWQSQMWVILVPTIAYAVLFFGQAWPKAKVAEASRLSFNLKSIFTSPLYLFIFFCMALTAYSEFGPSQWVGLILEQSGAEPLIILALTAGVMAVARYFGGNIVGKFAEEGVLLGSAIVATLGLFLLSIVTGPVAYLAAIVFGLGVAYFWPNMLGFIAAYKPSTGAIGMSLVGAMGMFANSIFSPITGGWIDNNKAEAAAAGLEGDALELAAGQETLQTMMLFPGALIILFTILVIWMRYRKSNNIHD